MRSNDAMSMIVPVVPVSREYPAFAGRKSVPLDPASVAAHERGADRHRPRNSFDCRRLPASARLIIETRNAYESAGAFFTVCWLRAEDHYVRREPDAISD
jgi:hypothetical protein